MFEAQEFSGLGQTLGALQVCGFLSPASDAEPDSVPVPWGNAGPFGQPCSATNLPQGDGSFDLPSPFESHACADGSDTIRATAHFAGGIDATEKLAAFFALNGTAGVSHAGTRLDDLMVGGSGDDGFTGGRGMTCCSAGWARTA